MGIATAGSFGCESCGKQYRWKPELAGKRAKCKCGAVVDCPASDPSPVEQDILDLAPVPPPPKPAPRPTAAAMPVMGASITATQVNSGSPQRAVRAKTLEYGTQSSAVTKLFPNPLMDLWAPLWVFAIAVVLEILLLPQTFRSPGRELPFAMGFLFVYMAFKSILLSVGLLVAVKFRQIQIGSLASAAIKLLALSIAPSATMDLLWLVTRFIPLGFLINWICGFVIYFALIGTFFDLDQEDTWYCVKVVFVINIAVALGLVFVIAHFIA